jgi:hypothetical protein
MTAEDFQQSLRESLTRAYVTTSGVYYVSATDKHRERTIEVALRIFLRSLDESGLQITEKQKP